MHDVYYLDLNFFSLELYFHLFDLLLLSYFLMMFASLFTKRRHCYERKFFKVLLLIINQLSV